MKVALPALAFALTAVAAVSAVAGQPVHADHAVNGTDTGAEMPAQGGMPSLANTIFLLYATGQTDESNLDRVMMALPGNVNVELLELSSSELERILKTSGGDRTEPRAPAGSGPIPDVGDFQYRYMPNVNATFNYTAAQWLQDIRFLETHTEWLNENFRLPVNVTLVAEECGFPNALYDSYNKTVVMCYEMAEYLWKLWGTYNHDDFYLGDSPRLVGVPSEFYTPEVCPEEGGEPAGHGHPDEPGEQGGEGMPCVDTPPRERTTPEAVFTPGARTDFVHSVMYEVLYHELGHAILDIYNIPYTGLEENVADQFAALRLSLNGKEGQTMMRNVGNQFMYAAAQGDTGPFYGTHALDAQRSFNFLCWAYGADPDANEDLVNSGRLPEDRVGWCVEEYDTLRAAFRSMLANYTNGFLN